MQFAGIANRTTIRTGFLQNKANPGRLQMRASGYDPLRRCSGGVQQVSQENAERGGGAESWIAGMAKHANCFMRPNLAVLRILSHPLLATFDRFLRTQISTSPCPISGRMA
jgi:hypothetical protein